MGRMSSLTIRTYSDEQRETALLTEFEYPFLLFTNVTSLYVFSKLPTRKILHGFSLRSQAIRLSKQGLLPKVGITTSKDILKSYVDGLGSSGMSPISIVLPASTIMVFVVPI